MQLGLLMDHVAVIPMIIRIVKNLILMKSLTIMMPAHDVSVMVIKKTSTIMTLVRHGVSVMVIKTQGLAQNLRPRGRQHFAAKIALASLANTKVVDGLVIPKATDAAVQRATDAAVQRATDAAIQKATDAAIQADLLVLKGKADIRTVPGYC
jgi:hypothetical protein